MKISNAVVYAVDDNQTNNIYLSYSIKTLFDHLTIPVDVYVLTTQSNTQIIENYPVKRINVDDLFQQFIANLPFQAKMSLTKFAFVRLAIPLISQLKQYDKILYLDTDTEIFKNLNDVFMIDLKNSEIGAVEENYPQIHFDQLTNDIKKLNFNPRILHLQNNKYVNSGVLLFSMQNILTVSYIERFNELMKIQTQCNFKNHDQDLLNIGFDIMSIDKKYNTFPNEYNKHTTTIVHYICHYKSLLLNRCLAI